MKFMCSWNYYYLISPRLFSSWRELLFFHQYFSCSKTYIATPMTQEVFLLRCQNPGRQFFSNFITFMGFLRKKARDAHIPWAFPKSSLLTRLPWIHLAPRKKNSLRPHGSAIRRESICTILLPFKSHLFILLHIKCSSPLRVHFN